MTSSCLHCLFLCYRWSNWGLEISQNWLMEEPGICILVHLATEPHPSALRCSASQCLTFNCASYTTEDSQRTVQATLGDLLRAGSKASTTRSQPHCAHMVTKHSQSVHSCPGMGQRPVWFGKRARSSGSMCQRRWHFNHCPVSLQSHSLGNAHNWLESVLNFKLDSSVNVLDNS